MRKKVKQLLGTTQVNKEEIDQNDIRTCSHEKTELLGQLGYMFVKKMVSQVFLIRLRITFRQVGDHATLKHWKGIRMPGQTNSVLFSFQLVVNNFKNEFVSRSQNVVESRKTNFSLAAGPLFKFSKDWLKPKVKFIIFS